MMLVEPLVVVSISFGLGVMLWLRCMPRAIIDRGRLYAVKVWLLGLGMTMMAAWRIDAFVDGYTPRWEATLTCWAFIAYAALHCRQIARRGALAWWEIRKDEHP